jgi:hypothetical protein
MYVRRAVSAAQCAWRGRWSGPRIVHEFSDFLSSPARARDLRRQFERVLARGHGDDGTPSPDSSSGPRQRPIGHLTIGADGARWLLLNPAAMGPDASVPCFANHRVRRFSDGGPIGSVLAQLRREFCGPDLFEAFIRDELAAYKAVVVSQK